MLEHLGLGITLELEDNFTPQANSALASFDRLQSGAEEMQENIGKSLSNLQNLMLSGFSLDTIGESVKNAGKSILGTFKSLGTELVNTNSMFDTLKAQMLTVFGSVEETQKKLNWASEFAVKTPFDVEGTVRAMQMMKSQGLDVTREFKNAKGEMKSFLEYMGDFATRNMSSTGGFEGMAFAISNALGGDFTSIRKRFDLAKSEADALKSIFETGGIEAFAEAFTDLADRLTPNAMRNMLGTWDQIMAEMEETWGVFLWKVGDTGAFDDIKRTIMGVSQTITGLTSDGNVKAFGEIVSALWKPIDFLVRGLNKVVQGVLAFTEKHPMVAKIGAGFLAVTGVILTLSGVLMKATGGVMIFATSLVSAWANLSVLGSLGVASNLTGLTTGIMSVVKWLGLAGVAVGAFAIAWHNNFMGIRDRGLTVFNQLKEAWSMSEIYFDKDFDVKYQKQLNMEMKLDTNGSMKQLNTLALKIAQFRALATGVLKALFRPKSDNGKVFFTDEEIAVFQNTGILLTIQKIVALRERVSQFFQGLGEGLGTVVAIGKEFINMVLTPIKGFFHAVGVNLRPIKEFFDSIFGFKEFPIPEDVALKQLENIKKLGKAVGAVFGAVMGFKLVSSITSFIVSPFKKLFDSLVKVKDTVGGLKDSLFGLKGKNIKVNVETTGANGVISSNSTTSAKKPSILQTIFGTNDKGEYVYDEAKDYIKSNANLLSWSNQDKKTQANSSNHKGYSQVYGSQMNDAYYKMRFWGREDVNPNRIFTDAPSKLSILDKAKETLFGRNYYTEQGNTLKKAGSFGGLFNVDKSDDQIRLATQDYKAKGKTYDSLSPSSFLRGYTTVNKDGSAGKFVSYDFTNPYQRYVKDENGKSTLNMNWVNKNAQLTNLRQQAMDGKIKYKYDDNLASTLRDRLDRRVDTDSVVGKLSNFNPNLGKEELSQYQANIAKRNQEIKNNPFKIAGVDARQYNAPKYKTVSQVDEETGETIKSKVLNPVWVEKQNQKKQDAKALQSDLFKNDSVLNENRSAIGAINTQGKQNVYKATRSKMGEMLFGQKYYKIDEDENGNLYRNTIARKGGLLRMGGNLREKDENGVMNRDKLTFNEEGNVSMITKLKSGIGSIGNELSTKIKSSFSNSISNVSDKFGKITHSISDVITNSKPVQAIKGLTSSISNTKPVEAIKGFLSNAKDSIMTSSPVLQARGFASIAKDKIASAPSSIRNAISSVPSTLRNAPSNIKNRIMTSSPVLQARASVSNLKDSFMTSTPVLQARGYASMAKDKLTNNRLTNAIRNQREVLGWTSGSSKTPKASSSNKPTSLLGKMGAGAKSFGTKLFGGKDSDGNKTQGAFSKLFGLGTKDAETGKRTGGGIVTRALRGTANVAKSGAGIVGRTAGLLGRGAMTMLPGAMAVGAIGSAFYKGMSNKGANVQGEDRQKLIKDAKLAPDASNFTVGLAQFKKELKNIDVKSMWDKLKTEGKNAWGLIKDIGTDMWAKIKENAGPMLSEAFEGIKGLAGVAWEWIKTDGIDLFMSMASSAMELVGNAFSWLGDNAGTIFGGIADFVVGTVLPKLLGAVTDLGLYIITHIPEILSSLVGIASGIFQGLLSIVTGIFSGIASFLWEAISGAFSGIGKFLLSALAVPIRAIPVIGNPVADALGLPVHHKGLWMSEEEHPAIIRKDETVLPPDISRKFNSVFNTQSDILEAKKENKNQQSSTPTSVDNSVRIDKVEIVVQADKLSRSDAREQAKMILEEFKKINNENKIRAYV